MKRFTSLVDRLYAQLSPQGYCEHSPWVVTDPRIWRR
jgi:hypothetical protein